MLSCGSRCFLLLCIFFLDYRLLHLSFHHIWDFFISFKTHILNNDSCQRAIQECLLHCKSWVICMNMNFHDLIIGNYNDRITDRFQILFKIHFLFDVKCLIKHNQELCTIAEFNLCLRLCLNIRRHGALGCRLGRCSFNCKIQLFTKECVISTL